MELPNCTCKDGHENTSDRAYTAMLSQIHRRAQNAGTSLHRPSESNVYQIQQLPALSNPCVAWGMLPRPVCVLLRRLWVVLCVRTRGSYSNSGWTQECIFKRKDMPRARWMARGPQRPRVLSQATSAERQTQARSYARRAACSVQTPIPAHMPRDVPGIPASSTPHRQPASLCLSKGSLEQSSSGLLAGLAAERGGERRLPGPPSRPPPAANALPSQPGKVSLRAARPAPPRPRRLPAGPSVSPSPPRPALRRDAPAPALSAQPAGRAQEPRTLAAASLFGSLPLCDSEHAKGIKSESEAAVRLPGGSLRGAGQKDRLVGRWSDFQTPALRSSPLMSPCPLRFRPLEEVGLWGFPGTLGTSLSDKREPIHPPSSPPPITALSLSESCGASALHFLGLWENQGLSNQKQKGRAESRVHLFLLSPCEAAVRKITHLPGC
ncbi:PREDICTED: uncharacterized protein LOC108514907 [Rhinopithecus bieti]|uniref:uncharacterized protein LOC108514907 n=1 Tax=Rhinopithecus bieti TaxID=61621 RepID=UPI00083C4264|nr:PREDICTED: uncharacterized protein LOC108514907 [Rhinopithecus bieti]